MFSSFRACPCLDGVVSIALSCEGENKRRLSCLGLWRDLLTLIVNVRGVIYHVNAMLDTHLDGVTGASVSTQPSTVPVAFVDARLSLFIRKVAILCRTGFRYL